MLGARARRTGSSSPYVMAAQALSGIAKDLTKMSSKSAVKLVVAEDQPGALYKWVAILTGSKNALKGVGFFLGGLLLDRHELPDGDAAARRRWSSARSSCTVPFMTGGLGRADAQGEVPPHVLQEPRGERPRGGAHLPLRLARRLVRRRAAGLPAHQLDWASGRSARSWRSG